MARVLVIEDEADLQEILRYNLGQAGHEVRVAATGALDEARRVALDYARRARARLDGELHRDELEALTHAVVDRER